MFTFSDHNVILHDIKEKLIMCHSVLITVLLMHLGRFDITLYTHITS